MYSGQNMYVLPRPASHSGLRLGGSSGQLPSVSLQRPQSSANLVRHRQSNKGQLVRSSSVASLGVGTHGSRIFEHAGQSSPARKKSNFKALEVGRTAAKTWDRPDAIFDVIDADGSGHVERTEVLRFFRGTLDEAKLEALLSELDADDSGTISREEWIQGYARAGFGQTTGLDGEGGAGGLSVLLDLVSHQRVDFVDLHNNVTPYHVVSHERGISIVQLRDIMRHIENRCEHETWMALDGKRLTPASVTWIDAMRYVFKPCTETHRCSYVERIAKERQLPIWFVSHWWGEPFCKTLEVIEQHARDRGISDTCPYFLSAVARNEWRAEPDWAVGPPGGPVAIKHVMTRCTGTLTVVDAQAVALSRTWILYETFITLAKLEHKWDVYTPLRHVCSYYLTKQQGQAHKTIHRRCTAVGLLESTEYAAVDLRLRVQNKAKRESYFPLSKLLSTFLAVDLNMSQAFKGSDKDALIAALTSLDAPPGASAPASPDSSAKATMMACDRLSANLRGRLALSALRLVAERGPGSDAYHACLGAVQRFKAPSMRLCLSSCAAFDESMALQLCGALPSTLSSLTLVLRDIDVEAGRTLLCALTARIKLGANPAGGLPALTRLVFECESIDQPAAAALGGVLAAHPKLRSVGFGLPSPLRLDAVQALTLGAKTVSKMGFFAEKLPCRHISLIHLRLTSSDLLLIIGSLISGSCGMVASLDISDNEIDDNGLKALKAAFEGKGKEWLGELLMIDLSNNKAATPAARQAVFEAARKCAKAAAGLDRKVDYEQTPGFQFRFELDSPDPNWPPSRGR